MLDPAASASQAVVHQPFLSSHHSTHCEPSPHPQPWRSPPASSPSLLDICTISLRDYTGLCLLSSFFQVAMVPVTSSETVKLCLVFAKCSLGNERKLFTFCLSRSDINPLSMQSGTVYVSLIKRIPLCQLNRNLKKKHSEA